MDFFIDLVGLFIGIILLIDLIIMFVWILALEPGILHQNAPQNLCVGTVANLAIWLETVQMKVSATPVVRQATVQEIALLLLGHLVT